MNKNKIIEGVIVCVNYSDFLAHTLPANKIHFNKLVVVTDSKDIMTKNICEYYHVQCIVTDIFYENGDIFNKGKAINEGLKHLSKEGWVVQLDADIYLPPMTRFILDKLQLDESIIYSIDRMMCPNYQAWETFINNPKSFHEGYIYVHMNMFPLGVRIAEYMGNGWEPIGYFQMWHPKTSSVHEYPTLHEAADRTDVLHAKKFKREKRQLIPELICVHLESETHSKMGANWNGRKTKIFGPREIEIKEEIIIVEKKEQLLPIQMNKCIGYKQPWYQRFIICIIHFFKKLFLDNLTD